jgi:LPXTG-motif cell wall-anchored protein
MSKTLLLAMVATLTLALTIPALADHNERHAQKQAEAAPVYMEPGELVDPMYADEGPAVVPETVPPTEGQAVQVTTTTTGESTTPATKTAPAYAGTPSKGTTPSGPGGSATSKPKELPRTGGAPVVLIVAGASIALSGLYLLRRRTR